ncbi:bestrophin family protein [Acidicapsa ligni]|uniref:bestrophin family protein n=1 Tax=Acidicapsa ligni TaxID=542300 RepID=UPI0021E07768|nr:bestrophin family ion channel [Acidicapsa ligni]
MIVRTKLNWLRMLFIWRGSVIRSVLPQLLTVLVISIIVTATHGYIYHYQVELTVAPFTLLGVSLAIFLGFRNSASYDRYWEARKQWGTLLNVGRSLVRQALTIGSLEQSTPQTQQRNKEWVALLAAFAHALRHQLRNTNPEPDLNRLLPPDICAQTLKTQFRPIALLTELGKWVSDGLRKGEYGEITAVAFDRNLNDLSEVVGACERLANTPLPYPYSVMIHRTLYLYCLLLPFGLVSTLDYMTPVISVLVAYTFIALETLADEIEEPFGTLPNDLAIEYFSYGIEHSLQEMIGQSVPEPISGPKQYILL